MKQEIIDAYNKWNEAEKLIPESDFMKGYKSRSAVALRHWRTFASLCKTENLEPVKTAHSLMGISNTFKTLNQ